ncbi:MAG: inorganic phosphate transporter [Clostridiales bacterium]|nr:inorganic phosphate transporter [Clostridiales bacterium]
MATGCLSLKKTRILAGLFNLLGVAAGFALYRGLAFTVEGLISFGSPFDGNTPIAAALGAVSIWAICAWYFGIPTSESHALASGLAGAALAYGSVSFGKSEWIKLVLGLICSVALGYILGCIVKFLLEKRNFSEGFYKNSQIFAAAATAFMHGSQDGLKFLGVYLLISGGELPSYAPVICGLLMAAGTLAGGRRIIEKVGIRMVSIKKYEGFAADVASSLTLFVFTLLGVPVSTTHTKTAAIMGGGHEGINKKIAYSIVAAWVITFPACGVISYILTKIILMIK